MTRRETISSITSRLATADDETLAAIADVLAGTTGDSKLPRPLTKREIELIQQSKTDFAVGDSLTSDQLAARLDEAAARPASSRGA